MAPQAPVYRTGAGQIVFLALFAAMIGVMVVIRRSVTPRPVPRILSDTTAGVNQVSPSAPGSKNPSQKTATTVGGKNR